MLRLRRLYRTQYLRFRIWCAGVCSTVKAKALIFFIFAGACLYLPLVRQIVVVPHLQQTAEALLNPLATAPLSPNLTIAPSIIDQYASPTQEKQTEQTPTMNHASSDANERRGLPALQQAPGVPPTAENGTFTIILPDTPTSLVDLGNDVEGLALDASKADPTHLHGIYARGEDGAPLWHRRPLTFKMTHAAKVQAHKGYCFNTRVSESLPLDRSVPDYNSKACRQHIYSIETLPKASVIITFHNENLSVLLRSVHSVLDRSAPELLLEIILVDDLSNRLTHPWLFGPLETYLAHVPKVRLLRLLKRHGLMRARMQGASLARGEVLVFLDSHIETTPQWLEPLLEAVAKNRTTVVVPLIHTIDFDTFNFERGALATLSFTWSLGQKHLPDPHSTFAPVPSPIMAGGLFAIAKSWFDDLGRYDRELNLYGGEEMEIGFKIWMCGGQLLLLPCSRVGHVFRDGKYAPGQVYKVPAEEIYRNKLRVAAVWMDEYAALVRQVIPPLPPELPLGSLDEASSVRDRLKCQSFKWYLDNVATDVVSPDLGPGTYIGAFRAAEFNACLDTLQKDASGEHLGAYPCHNQGGSQTMILELSGTLRLAASRTLLCIVPDGLPSPLPVNLVMTSDCARSYAKRWRFDTEHHRLIYDEAAQGAAGSKHTSLSSFKCAQVISATRPLSPFDLQLSNCDTDYEMGYEIVFDNFTYSLP